MLSQKQIDDLIQFLEHEIDVLETGEVYIWKHKESRDRGQSWLPTNRIEVYKNALAILENPELPEDEFIEIEPDTVEDYDSDDD